MVRLPFLITSLFLLATIFFLPISGNAQSPTDVQPSITTPGVAVLELFTSQGCSSCPPADRLLQNLKQENETSGQQVYCLSFHVDYWNRLGWKDPYSKSAFSERQRDYARAFRANRIYTPQMIVNGEHRFVGSNKALAQKFTESSLKTKAKAVVKLDVALHSKLDGPRNSSAEVFYEVRPADPASQLNIAMVESTVSNKVPLGENSGETLTHVNVVRVFETIDLDAASKGHLVMEIPKSVDAEAIEFIAYVQDKSTQRILGARRIVPGNVSTNQLTLTKQQWRNQLTPDQFHITREMGTETPVPGADTATRKSGIYTCSNCGARLFDAATKFKSGTGWPSFWQPLRDGSTGTAVDRSHGMVRTEVRCERCGAHIGHVFDDGPPPTGQRWCLNSIALTFIENSSQPLSDKKD